MATLTVIPPKTKKVIEKDPLTGRKVEAIYSSTGERIGGRYLEPIPPAKALSEPKTTKYTVKKPSGEMVERVVTEVKTPQGTQITVQDFSRSGEELRREVYIKERGKLHPQYGYERVQVVRPVTSDIKTITSSTSPKYSLPSLISTMPVMGRSTLPTGAKTQEQSMIEKVLESKPPQQRAFEESAVEFGRGYAFWNPVTGPAISLMAISESVLEKGLRRTTKEMITNIPKAIPNLIREVKESPAYGAGMVLGIATPFIMGKFVKPDIQQASLTKVYPTEPEKGLAKSTIVTKVGEQKVKSVAKTRYITKPEGELTKTYSVSELVTEGQKEPSLVISKGITQAGEGELAKTFDISKTISEVGGKIRTQDVASKGIVKSISPDISASLGILKTETGMKGVYAGLTKIERVSPSFEIVSKPSLGTVLGQEALRTAVETTKISTKPFVGASATGIITETKALPQTEKVGEKSLPKSLPQIVSQSQAYFSKVGTIAPKVETKVLTLPIETSEEQIKERISQVMTTGEKAETKQLPRMKEKLEMPKPEKALEKEISRTMEKLGEVQRMRMRALEAQHYREEYLSKLAQRLVTLESLRKKVISRYVPSFPSLVVPITPPFLGSGGKKVAQITKRKGEKVHPLGKDYFEKIWPVLSEPKELRKMFGRRRFKL